MLKDYSLYIISNSKRSTTYITNRHIIRIHIFMEYLHKYIQFTFTHINTHMLAYSHTHILTN